VVRLRRDRSAMVALFMLTCFSSPPSSCLVIAIDPYQQSLRDSLSSRRERRHIFGTDHSARRAATLIDGGRVSSRSASRGSSFAGIGGLIGLVAGYFGGWTDRS